MIRVGRVTDQHGQWTGQARALRTRIGGEVDVSQRRRAEYASDASNYRVLPEIVTFPRDESDVAAILEFARAEGLSITARGAGTSVAGNAIGPGIVLDFSRHMHAVTGIDPEHRTARVQPGVVLAALQRSAGAYGLRYGPDPSTQNRCTLGGMIGNNACGPHALAWGRTSDTVRELRILDGTGTQRLLAGELDALPGLDRFTNANLAVLRTELGRFERQASGYALEHLLPERGSSVAKSFVGTEGTCGLLLDATVELVEVPPVSVLVVLGYPDMACAADDIEAVVAAAPVAVEGIDARLVDVVRVHRGTVPKLPRGGGWLFVELAGADLAAVRDAAAALCRDAHALDSRIVEHAGEAAALWRIRADGAGLAGRTPDGDPAWPGWEDAAVPPQHLGAYLRDFADLTREHGVDGLLYGHIADGCMHVRLDLPVGTQRFRSFLTEATELVISYGGSLSGEHGDGRARSELLSLMYSPEALAAFAGYKALFDPDSILNPGVLVEPKLIDTDLRLAGAGSVPAVAGGFTFPRDENDLSTAVHRCVGLGKCRADTRASGGFMCPSYLATADEKDNTRGRARVLQEVAQGSLSWSSPAVAESLDLCLSCKACRSDCPAGVDVATYKSEALYRRYRRRLRPPDHYTLGWLPRWLRAATCAPRIANRAARIGPLRRLGMRAAGVDPRRAAPELAERNFHRQWQDESRRRLWQDESRRLVPTDAADGVLPVPSTDDPGVAEAATVLLWIDSFTDAFDPDIAWAAAQLLTSLGYRVRVPRSRVCCGLTWISTGQLQGARARLRKTVAELDDHVRGGGLVVGLEPSCTATLRADLPELLADDPRAEAVAGAVRTLGEFLAAHPQWHPPKRSGQHVVVQPHCHQHAIFGFDTDRRILADMDVSVTEITGCCGLAGNFGMQRGHYDISVAIARNGMIPALGDVPDDSILIADGFSCRTQAAQLSGWPAQHLAQFLLEK